MCAMATPLCQHTLGLHCPDVLHTLRRSARAPKQMCNVQLYAAPNMTVCVGCHQAFAHVHSVTHSRSCLVGTSFCCLLHMSGAVCLEQEVAWRLHVGRLQLMCVQWTDWFFTLHQEGQQFSRSPNTQT